MRSSQHCLEGPQAHAACKQAELKPDQYCFYLFIGRWIPDIVLSVRQQILDAR